MLAQQEVASRPKKVKKVSLLIEREALLLAIDVELIADKKTLGVSLHPNKKTSFQYVYTVEKPKVSR